MSSAQNLSHGAHGFDLADRILRVFEIFCRDWQHDDDPFAMVRHHGLVVVGGLSRGLCNSLVVRNGMAVLRCQKFFILSSLSAAWRRRDERPLRWKFEFRLRFLGS
jgi:hypothetical protein